MTNIVPRVMRDEAIEATQAKLAARFRLSRQMALMMALLVCLPTVTPPIMHSRIGSGDHRNLMVRLRARLREFDEAPAIRTVYGFGYYIDDDARLALLSAAGWTPPKAEDVRASEA